jgi:hypothetical protein
MPGTTNVRFSAAPTLGPRSIDFSPGPECVYCPLGQAHSETIATQSAKVSLFSSVTDNFQQPALDKIVYFFAVHSTVKHVGSRVRQLPTTHVVLANITMDAIQ